MRLKKVSSKDLSMIVAISVLISTFFIPIQNVHASDTPYAKVYPSEGDIYTDIYVQVRNLDIFMTWDGSLGKTSSKLSLYLFWDDVLVLENVANPSEQSGLVGRIWFGYYDLHIKVPNEYPYSNLGNHTICVEIWNIDTFCTNFTLTFQVVKYYPPVDMLITWWNNLTEAQKQLFKGPKGDKGDQGIQGIQGVQGVQGIQGIQGVQGVKGDKGDSYPIEAVALNLGISSVSTIASVIALSMVYKMRKELRNAK